MLCAPVATERGTRPRWVPEERVGSSTAQGGLGVNLFRNSEKLGIGILVQESKRRMGFGLRPAVGKRGP